MAVNTLEDMLQADARAWRQASQDALLTPEQYRYVLQSAVPIFRESTLRPAFPTTVVNDPGVLKSRHIKIVDMGDAEHGMSGTGGTFDRVDQDPKDVFAYAIWKNVLIPWREQEASARGGGLDVLSESGMAAGQIVVEKENKMLSAGLGPNKGLTNATGIQTFAAAAAWTSAGQAYKDVVKAVIDKLGVKKVPQGQAALLVHPTDMANLYQTFSNTDAAQLEKVERLLPGGVFSTTQFAAGKAYVYARTPTAVEYRVYQDLTVVPLPKVDEDHRMRVRTIGALHIKNADAVVEITGL